jgi:aminoglycoside phosphotransferase family enzyme/predicted kinase
MTVPVATSGTLITAMQQARVYDHPVRAIELIETHISWVILTGDYVYKIKKPVDLGFLDFSTLEKRRHCCAEELRLNRRLAPDLYLDVVAITGTPQRPRLGGDGTVIEYAVKMAQFPQAAQFDRLLARGALTPVQLDAVAHLVADFHCRAEVAGADTAFGDPETVLQPVEENFRQVRECIGRDAPALELLATLERWSRQTFAQLHPVLVARKSGGFVRECHGDLHLRNLAWVGDRPLAFDCIEFNPALRWIDVISEVAFLVMDLQDHDRLPLARRYLNGYLERGGDYAGVRMLPFYLAYRAMVRAKVEAIRATQPGRAEGERTAGLAAFQGYLALAEGYTIPGRPVLLVTRGLSASGKTTLTQPLLERLGAIRIRSDVERKRLFGLTAEADGQAAAGEGMYSPEAGRRTYARLVELAGTVLEAGFTVIIDAACLEAEQLARFRTLAGARHVVFTILEFHAPADVLHARIRTRARGASDADVAILEHQLANWQPLPDDMAAHCLRIDTTRPFDAAAVQEQLAARGAAGSSVI